MYKYTLLVFLLLGACAAQTQQPSPTVEASVAPGINKAFVSPSLNTDEWADRFTGESREVHTARFAVLETIGLNKGSSIADVGAGTGLYVKLFAETVGSTGKVYAVDISEKFLKFIDENASADGLTNVETVLGEDRTTKLPNASVDFIFHSDTYHHFEFPAAMNADMLRALRSGGEMLVLDFERIPGVTSERLLEHVRAPKETVITEIEASGFVLIEEINLPDLKENYLLRFKKP